MDPKNTGDEFVIPGPEDLAGLTNEALRDLHETAGNNFDSLYGDGKDLSAEDLEALEALTEGLERIQTEVDKRQTESAERAEKAAELAKRVRPVVDNNTEVDVEDTTEQGEDEADGGNTDDDAPDEGARTEDVPEQDRPQTQPTEEVTEVEREPELVAAATVPGPTRVSMSRVRSRAARRPVPRTEPQELSTLADIMTASTDGIGFHAGQGITWAQAGQIVDRHMASFREAPYEAANRAGRHLTQTFPIASLNRPKPPELTINSGDPDEIERVLKTAVDQSRVPGGSLTAAGGWCAPSEIYYDLTEMEGRDGLLSLPEIRVNRGGFQRTLGPDFKDLWQMGYGFVYTEQQDIDGTYGTDEFGIGDGSAGSKPCITIPCTEWEEFRLGVDGICVSAGLLMQKGYPELIARTIRGVLVGHDHIQSGRYIKRLVDGSDPVTMPAPAGGAVAPLLEAIALQVDHMRSIRRIPRATTFEAKFPIWVHDMLRSDLAKQGGMEAYNVTDAQINAWFTSRNISPQFLYNWQDIGGEAADFVDWPREVSFLLYPAGTWVKGGDDIINVSNLMDSQLLGQNNYIALFTEESWLVAKMGFDSRVVTVPVCPNGATANGVDFPCEAATAVTTTTTTQA